MEFLYTSFCFLFLLIAYKFYTSNNSHKNLPPSPFSVPIFGHVHLLFSKLSLLDILNKLTQIYGPIIFLKVGCRAMVIISSPSIAKECFTKNDIILSGRPKMVMNDHLNYNNVVAWMPYGDDWRHLRRIATAEIFSANHLQVMLNNRKDEIKRSLYNLSRNSCQDFTKVNMRSEISKFTFNLIMRMVVGERYSVEDAEKFKETLEKIFENPSGYEDYLPILGWINGGKFRKKVGDLMKGMDNFMQDLIEGRRSDKGEDSNGGDTVLDHLLTLQESSPEHCTDDNIRGIMEVMFLGGVDTIQITLEWAMSNLVNHPEILINAKTELDSQIGQNRLLEESDLQKLPFLHNIILETLRLYPPGPLILPHCASGDCNISGYHVPSDTIILFNVIAIQRDPAFWENPMKFQPQRFEFDRKNETYTFFPFGKGRRACPGEVLAQRILCLILGSLIQCFEWKRIDEDLVDMSEMQTLVLNRVKPLEVMFKARDIMKKSLI